LKTSKERAWRVIANCAAVGDFQRAAVRSFRPDARLADHLAPLLDLGRHVGAERVGAKDDGRGGHVGKPRAHRRVRQPRVDLAVEPLADFRWRYPRHALAALGFRYVTLTRLDD